MLVALRFFNRDPLAPKLVQHPVQVRDAIANHERRFAWFEVIGIRWKDRPDRSAQLFGMILCSPLKIRVAVRCLKTESLSVPASETDRVTGFEKNSANAAYFFHAIIVMIGRS